MKNYDVVIIGAGTAGLSARKVVSKYTQSYVIIDDGILGTTCARVGCMPSKAFIQIANDFHRRNSFQETGIDGSELLKIDSEKVMSHTRKLRDRFVRSVLGGMEEWKNEHFIAKRARFVNKNVVDLGDEKISGKKIIIATGSSPVIPKPWLAFSDFFIDTNSFFELRKVPQSIGVIGLGVIGIELGQALHRLGIDVVGISQGRTIAGLSDPKLIEYTSEKLSQEMSLDFSGVQTLSRKDDKLSIQTADKEYLVEKALISVGRQPNLSNLGIENLGLSLDERGIPYFNAKSCQLRDAQNIFIAGDVDGVKAILHESADDGAIAGYNACHEKAEEYERRTWLGITFSSPNIATVGKRYSDLVKEKIDFEYGEVSFEGQGRSIVMLSEKGHLRVYGDKRNNRLLGAELFAPSGEHIAHSLAWVISQKMTVGEVLQLPFYHPVVEEGLRTALRDLAKKLPEVRSPLEIAVCQEHDTSMCE
ncbi:MAG: dihydrolipoyl dehydrogenase [Bdellovibrionaceae bacterium]|nr:dihydrolipoyl dehydrogenase [Pseudobdellovibrionaceae bacterium]